MLDCRRNKRCGRSVGNCGAIDRLVSRQESPSECLAEATRESSCRPASFLLAAVHTSAADCFDLWNSQPAELSCCLHVLADMQHHHLPSVGQKIEVHISGSKECSHHHWRSQRLERAAIAIEETFRGFLCGLLGHERLRVMNVGRILCEMGEVITK